MSHILSSWYGPAKGNRWVQYWGSASKIGTILMCFSGFLTDVFPCYLKSEDCLFWAPNFNLNWMTNHSNFIGPYLRPGCHLRRKNILNYYNLDCTSKNKHSYIFKCFLLLHSTRVGRGVPQLEELSNEQCSTCRKDAYVYDYEETTSTHASSIQVTLY